MVCLPMVNAQHTFTKPITSSVTNCRLWFKVYSGEVDTVGGILAALNVTDWAWPPYASNIVLELWRRRETETLPRVGLFRILALRDDDFFSGAVCLVRLCHEVKLL